MGPTADRGVSAEAAAAAAWPHGDHHGIMSLNQNHESDDLIMIVTVKDCSMIALQRSGIVSGMSHESDNFKDS